jgi:hypothetical protein
MEDRYANGELHHARWPCRCDCGTRRSVSGADLRSGHSRSCGCANAESPGRRFRTHGQSGTRLYSAWANMMQRCHNPANHRYRWYGGRGIEVCQQWWSYRDFAAWAAKSGYEDGLTIERVDVNGNYEPANCTWIPKRRMQRNRRTSRFIEAWGETKTVADWADDERCVVGYYTLFSRLQLGWRPEEAISTPPRSGRRSE